MFIFQSQAEIKMKSCAQHDILLYPSFRSLAFQLIKNHS